MSPLPSKEKITLAELIIIVVVIAVLMTSVGIYFFKHQGQVTQAGLNNISHVFAARINAMRAQWMMDAQPRMLFIDDQLSDNKITVHLNAKGWVDNGQTTDACQENWQQVMGSSIEQTDANIAAIWLTLNTVAGNKHSHCRFSLSSGEYFTYTPSNGKITEVQLVNN